MIGHAQGELLAQLRPAVTTAVTLLQADELRIEVTLILVTVIENGSSTEIFLYHDDDGTTYDDDTVIASEVKVETDSDNIFQAQHPGSGIMIKPGGSLGIKVSTASQINVSVYGVTQALAERVRS